MRLIQDNKKGTGILLVNKTEKEIREYLMGVMEVDFAQAAEFETQGGYIAVAPNRYPREIFYIINENEEA